MKKFAVIFAVLALIACPSGGGGKEHRHRAGVGCSFHGPSQQDETITTPWEGTCLTDSQQRCGRRCIPRLAESWTIGDDQLTWTFNLRKGVKFHDGSDFTAEDVAYTIEVCRGSLLKNFTASIDKVEIVDPHTVKIITKAPTAILLESWCPSAFCPRTTGLRPAETAFNQAPVGRPLRLRRVGEGRPHRQRRPTELLGRAGQDQKSDHEAHQQRRHPHRRPSHREVDVIEDVPSGTWTSLGQLRE